METSDCVIPTNTTPLPETDSITSLTDNEKLRNVLADLDIPVIKSVRSLQSAIRSADIMASVINMKKLLGNGAAGDPNEVYNLLPAQLKGIDILDEARLIELNESKLSVAERKLVRVLNDIYHARLNALESPSTEPVITNVDVPPVLSDDIEIGKIQHHKC